MKGRTNAKVGPTPQDTPSLAELLSDSDDGGQFDYDGIEWAAFGNFAKAAITIGALVSLYVSSSDNSIIVSIRFGTERRAFGYTSAAQMNNGLAAVTKKLSAYAKGRSGL